LHDKYEDLGILAFPCNCFGKQEPGSNDEILEFAEKRGAKFLVFDKVSCEAGDQTHPLFDALKHSLDMGILGRSIKWNFTKYLIGEDGVPVKRFGPQEVVFYFVSSSTSNIFRVTFSTSICRSQKSQNHETLTNSILPHHQNPLSFEKDVIKVIRGDMVSPTKGTKPDINES